MILVLISWFHIEDMISYNRKIWKVFVAKKKNIGIQGLPTKLKEHIYKFHVKHRVFTKNVF
jgi:hypothetical protein